MKPRKSVITDFIRHWRPEPKEPPGLKGTSSWWCTRGCERCIPAFQQRYWVLPRDWSSDWAAPTLSGQEMVCMHRLHPNCLPSPGISSNSQCPHWKHCMAMMLFELIQQSLVICSCLLVRLVRKEDSKESITRLCITAGTRKCCTSWNTTGNFRAGTVWV